MYLIFGFTLPAGLNVYFLVSSLFRIGQQTLIYKMDPSLLSASGARTIPSREVESTDKKPSGGKPSPDKPTKDKPTTDKPVPKSSNGSAKASRNGSAKGKPPEPPVPPRIANRPTKKKKRR
jgi:YidC/Oxa1 family membrane protein insertase